MARSSPWYSTFHVGIMNSKNHSIFRESLGLRLSCTFPGRAQLSPIHSMRLAEKCRAPEVFPPSRSTTSHMLRSSLSTCSTHFGAKNLPPHHPTFQKNLSRDKSLGCARQPYLSSRHCSQGCHSLEELTRKQQYADITIKTNRMAFRRLQENFYQPCHLYIEQGGDTMEEHIEIGNGSSNGSQQVMSPIPTATSMDIYPTSDYDERINAKDGMSAVESNPGEVIDRRVFLWISHFPRLCIPMLLSRYSPRFIGSQYIAIKSRPNLATLHQEEKGTENQSRPATMLWRRTTTKLDPSDLELDLIMTQHVCTCARAQLIGCTKPPCLIEAGLCHLHKSYSQKQEGLATLLQQAQLDNRNPREHHGYRMSIMRHDDNRPHTKVPGLPLDGIGCTKGGRALRLWPLARGTRVREHPIRVNTYEISPFHAGVIVYRVRCGESGSKGLTSHRGMLGYRKTTLPQIPRKLVDKYAFQADSKWLDHSEFHYRWGPPGFSHMGIAPDDIADRRIFSGLSRFPHPCIPAMLHTHLVSP
ncbi:hypothetical protein PR048_011902 [Dryococelus australis]|uniref:Uncharacterized protein n=1 Tax=Dryococelus australis TaxID=614101 RepID=A0ABQ9HMU4_9NEOP|nr:hypothetical protein PR048_011902 [Dryococelus australis]